MKTINIFTFLVMISFFMACGKKQQEQTPANGKANAELAAKKSQKTPEAPEQAEPQEQTVSPGIAGIKDAWRGQPITLETSNVNIQSLALAFCNSYPGFEPNRMLRDHLAGQTKQTEQQGYSVNLEERNGYVCIETTTELPTGTTLCYWKRNNGHKLLAAWMEFQEEGKKAENLLTFYDYDPNTKVLQPEPKLTDELEGITKKFNEWSLRLPSEGKDIEIMSFSGSDSEENYKCIYYNWKWNGMTFNFDPNGHE